MLWKTSKKLAAQKCPAAENFEKLVRRVTFLFIGTGLLIAILMVGVAGYTFYRINRVVAEVSEPLVPLVPLVRGITDPLQGADKSYELKKKWGVLKQDQVEAFGKFKEKALDEARSSVNKGRSELSKMEKYSHQQARKIESGVEKLSEWWDSQVNHMNERGILERLEPN